jgi:hypothetical protein
MLHCNRRIAMSVGVLFHWAVTHCVAGDAVFSRDGARIRVLLDTDGRPALQEIELGIKTIRNIALTQLSASDWLCGITCSDEGRIFCTTKESLWSFDPTFAGLTKIRWFARLPKPIIKRTEELHLTEKQSLIPMSYSWKGSQHQTCAPC